MPIFKSVKNLPKKINFIITNHEIVKKYESDFKYLEKLFEINYTYEDKINPKKRYLTINPIFYYENFKNINIDLFIISLDEKNSNFINLVRYIKSNNKKKIEFKISSFKKFLFNFYSHTKPKNIVNVLLSYIHLRIIKFYINNKIWLPFIIFINDSYKGHYLGSGNYNYYFKKNKKFNNNFKFVYSKLSDQISKKIYFETIYAKPAIIWKNFFNKLFNEEQYQDYLNFKNNDIINLGVHTGFELPFFMTSDSNKIINIDPTGDKYLIKYVSSFIPYFNKELLFDKSYLYTPIKVTFNDPKNFAKNISKEHKKTNLINILKKYSCQKNLIIKCDLDGIETHLLEEIDEIIKYYRPQLAISIYHIDKNFDPVISHLTVLPKVLIKNCLNYKFFINHYSYHRKETIFYCIPDEVYKKN